jgi:hypothetical protein
MLLENGRQSASVSKNQAMNIESVLEVKFRTLLTSAVNGDEQLTSISTLNLPDMSLGNLGSNYGRASSAEKRNPAFSTNLVSIQAQDIPVRFNSPHVLHEAPNNRITA